MYRQGWRDRGGGPSHAMVGALALWLPMVETLASWLPMVEPLASWLPMVEKLALWLQSVVATNNWRRVVPRNCLFVLVIFPPICALVPAGKYPEEKFKIKIRKKLMNIYKIYKHHLRQLVNQSNRLTIWKIILSTHVQLQLMLNLKIWS